jgi:Pilus assembly protein, PilP
MSTALHRGGAVLALLVLAGCSANQDELRGWMDGQRRDVKPNVTALAAPKKFDPEPYASAQAVDPFSAQKLSVAIKQEARQPNSLLAAWPGAGSRLPCCGSTTCCTRSSWVTTWARILAVSPASAKQK